MISRSFELDKNYILRRVQNDLKEDLIEKAIRRSIENYLNFENPMGLEDDFILNLKKIKDYKSEFLIEFYQLSASIYRLLNPGNQLEFIWDGRSQDEKYEEEWSKVFITWIDKLHFQKNFDRIILKGAVLNSGEIDTFLKASLKRILQSNFKVYQNNRGQLRKMA